MNQNVGEYTYLWTYQKQTITWNVRRNEKPVKMSLKTRQNNGKNVNYLNSA